MSHFTVLVIGDNPEKQLRPYQENNMGDCPEEFMEFEETDVEERKKEYETGTRKSYYGEDARITPELYDQLSEAPFLRRIMYIVDKKTSELFQYYKLGKKCKGYYEDAKGKKSGYIYFEVVQIIETTHPDKDVCFEGKITVMKIAPPKEVPFKDMYGSFEDFMKDWSGESIDEKTGKYGYWRNPNAKWDWYQLGGRWTGFFKLKNGLIGKVGDPSLVSNRRAGLGTSDQCRKGDIDFDEMRIAEEKRFAKLYDLAMSIIGDLPINKTFDELRGDKKDIKQVDEVRDKYWAQPRCKAWKAAEKKDFQNWPFGWDTSPDDFLISREEYISKAGDGAISTHAVIKDGKWYERGSMGWWAIVSNEKDNWDEEFGKLLDSVPDDTLLSVYDCHI